MAKAKNTTQRKPKRYATHVTTPTGERVYISAKTANGEAKDICMVSGDGSGLEIGFNNRYLMDALRYAPAESVRMELNTGISPCIITPVSGEDNFLYMVLPVRLKAQ